MKMKDELRISGCPACVSGGTLLMIMSSLSDNYKSYVCTGCGTAYTGDELIDKSGYQSDNGSEQEAVSAFLKGLSELCLKHNIWLSGDGQSYLKLEWGGGGPTYDALSSGKLLKGLEWSSYEC
jgi:hypothetical protein